MKKTRGFLLAAGVSLALAFTFSCDSGGGGGGGGSSVSYGGKTYKTVKIGTQTWFAENLNYDPGTGNSACYDNQASNCATYGRLYDWSTALTVCPSGWHLPSGDEWTVLTDYVGSSTAGTKLKATSGWKYISEGGTDDYGFSALSGGGFVNSNGDFSGVGSLGYWWSASDYEDGSSFAYGWYMSSGASNVLRFIYNKSSALLSVRCVQD
jgi:uncharacterized protein (TIGR02145 family)